MGRRIEENSGSARPGIAIPGDAKNKIAAWAKKNHRELGRTVASIIDWFLDQDSLVQEYIVTEELRQHKTVRDQVAEKVAAKIHRGDPPKRT